MQHRRRAPASHEADLSERWAEACGRTHRIDDPPQGLHVEVADRHHRHAVYDHGPDGKARRHAQHQWKRTGRLADADQPFITAMAEAPLLQKLIGDGLRHVDRPDAVPGRRTLYGLPGEHLRRVDARSRAQVERIDHGSDLQVRRTVRGVGQI